MQLERELSSPESSRVGAEHESSSAAAHDVSVAASAAAAAAAAADTTVERCARSTDPRRRMPSCSVASSSQL